MEGTLAALEATSIAQALRASRWGYAAVNAAHILGIALLVGAAVPLNLRLLGLWRRIPRAVLVGVLAPSAASGLALAATAGALLFSVRATEYAALPVLWLKLALVATGTVTALTAHLAYGEQLDGAPARRLAAHAAVSLGCWIGALVCGRLIAFVGD